MDDNFFIKARKSYNSVSKNGMKSRAIKGYQVQI